MMSRRTLERITVMADAEQNPRRAAEMGCLVSEEVADALAPRKRTYVPVNAPAPAGLVASTRTLSLGPERTFSRAVYRRVGDGDDAGRDWPCPGHRVCRVEGSLWPISACPPPMGLVAPIRKAIATSVPLQDTPDSDRCRPRPV